MKKTLFLLLLSALTTVYCVAPWDENFLNAEKLTTFQVLAHYESYNAAHSPISLTEFAKMYRRIHTLKLEGISGEDLSSLMESAQELSTLRRLSLRNVAHFSDTTPFANLPQLRWVNLSGTTITSLEGLKALKELRILELQDCPNLTNFEELLSFTSHLQELNLIGSKISNPNHLHKFDALKTLRISNTPLASLPHYSTLNNLKLLEINNMTALSDLKHLEHNSSIEKLVFNDPEYKVPEKGYGRIGRMTNLHTLDFRGHNLATPGEIFLALKGSRRTIKKLSLYGVAGVPFSFLREIWVSDIELGPFAALSEPRQAEFVNEYLANPHIRKLVIHKVPEDLLNGGDWSMLNPNIEHLRIENRIDLRTFPEMPNLFDLHISEAEVVGGEGFATNARHITELRCKFRPIKEFVASGRSTAEFAKLKKLRLFCSRDEPTIEQVHAIPNLETLSIHCDVFENHPRSFWESIQVLVDRGVDLDSKTRKELENL